MWHSDISLWWETRFYCVPDAFYHQTPAGISTFFIRWHWIFLHVLLSSNLEIFDTIARKMFVRCMYTEQFIIQRCEMNVASRKWKAGRCKLGTERFFILFKKNYMKGRFSSNTYTQWHQLSWEPKKNFLRVSQRELHCGEDACFPSRWRCRGGRKAHFAQTHTSFPEIWGCPNKLASFYLTTLSKEFQNF